VKVSGAHPGETAGQRELFTEETTSVLIFENGGVIQLSAAVAPGQLLFLANVESKREVVAQVKRKRAYKPTICYVELEFAEPAPRFWGMEFSAATALLPKNAKDAEAAALVTSAEAIAEEPGEPPRAPAAEEVQALKREVQALKEELKLMQTPAATQQAPAAHVGPDASGTNSNSSRGSDEAFSADVTGLFQPVEPHPVPLQLTPAEQTLLPNPSLDFTMSFPKSRRLFGARGKFTPGSRARLALLTTVLVVTVTSAAWFEHWNPWKPGTKKPSVSAPTMAVSAKTPPLASREAPQNLLEFSDIKVISRTPVTSPGTRSIAAEPPSEPLALSGSVAQPAVRRPSSSSTLEGGNRATVRPTAKVTSAPIVPSVLESLTVPPKLIKSVRAVASLDDLHDFETGNVVIDAVVGTEGEVHFMSVISGPPSLRAPAVRAVKQYQYEPATRNGQPVPAHVNITIRFRFES
jgi:TonB family protein